MSEFLFDQSPWEALISAVPSGGSVPAVQLLAMLESDSDEAVEDAFAAIEERNLSVELSGFPIAAGSGQAAARLQQELQWVKEDLDLRSMEENDPLRLYLEELSSVPAFGDETVFAQRFLSGDSECADALTNLGLSRVVQISKEYAGYGVLLLDLIQEGSIGLWQAIQNYRGGDYSSFRDKMIRNNLARAVLMQARSNGIGQKLRQSMQDFRSTDERLLSELGRNPAIEEIAAALHISPEEAQSIRKMLDDAFLLDQAEKLVHPEEEKQEEELPVEDTAYFQMRERIEDLLSQLSEEDARILTLRFGLEKGLPMTAEEVGRSLRIPAYEITSREAAALAKLRKFS